MFSGYYKFIFFIVLFSASVVNSQNKLEHTGREYANATDAEKIYVQLSGSAYDTNETIWFKAIVTNAFLNTPTNKSSVLHVELIDPLEQKIVDSKILKIENGIADGFFELHSNHKQGKYILRAYTEWNKNFGTDYVFSSEVAIYKFIRSIQEPKPIRDIIFTKDLDKKTFTVSSEIFPSVLDSLHKGKSTVYIDWKGGSDSIEIKQKKGKGVPIIQNIPSDVQLINYRLKTQNKTFNKSVVLDNEYGSLQFFPEGGALVNGLESILGVKYLDYRGKGAKVKGVIVDDTDTKVVSFESNILGMGKVIFLPEKGKTYYGKLTTKNGNTFKYELPKANSNGVALRIHKTELYSVLSLRPSIKTADSVFLKVYHRGKDMFLLKGKFKAGSFFHRLENKDLPHGIIGVTAYDKNYRPICERQFFNNIPKDNLEISVATNKTEFVPRDSVKVSIETKKDGIPVPASVSTMAIDADYFKDTNVDRSTIISYFLLQSDLRGEIENPSYYFKNAKNLRELDNLMLTQGWTNYKYDTPQKPKYIQPESGLEISGTVGGIQNLKKRKKSKNSYAINMMMFGKPLEVYNQEIDSTGRFKFVMPDSYGAGKKFVIQPSDEQNKSNNFVVNVNQRKVLEVDYPLDKVIVPVDSIVEKKMIEKIKKNIRKDPFLLPNAIALNEVEVSDYELTPKRAEMSELHGLPDVVINNKELLQKKKNWTSRLYSWLLFNYGQELRVDRVGSGSGFQIAKVHGADFTYVVIDGIPVSLDNYKLVPDIPLHAVKSTEIIRNTATANRYFYDIFECAACSPPPFPAILAIYTYSGKGLYGAFPEKTNLLNDTAPQYSPKREFYAPEYSNPEKIDWNVPDIRTLLHWEPNIVTNLEGKAETTFFNSDTSGKKIIICEGITSDGNVGYSEIMYDVIE